MKTQKIIYYVTTGLLSLMLVGSSAMYIFKNEDISQLFTGFGYPTYLIYPLALAKLSAVIVLWTNLKTLKEWAYSALFFEFILAFFAHFMIGDGEQTGALIAIVLLFASYFTSKKLQAA
ncbi:MAG: DoxX family protein [Flavobacteriales bacterium]|jgi:hypothetical protein|nr:DoxX family protein [Flavobacteriales bacterium]